MKKLFVFILSFWACVSVSAQKRYFIYLESDNGLPFYVRTTDKVYSSSPAGYLILPELPDSNYTLFVGFPSTQSKEAKFIIKIEGADRGFSIKHTEGSLGLLDLQNRSLIKTVRDQSASNVTYEARSDAFTTLLSKAAEDSSLLMVPIFAKAELPKAEEQQQTVAIHTAEKKPKTEEPVQKINEDQLKREDSAGATALVMDTVMKFNTDSSVAGNPKEDKIALEKKQEKTEAEEPKQEVLPPQNNASANSTGTQPEEEYKRSIIKKFSESSTSEGFGLVYFDTQGETVDTIRLLIPNPKVLFRQPDTGQTTEKMFLDIKKDPVVETTSKNEDRKNEEANPKGKKTDSDKNKSTAAAPRAQCPDQASDNDFFKVRRDMASKQTDEAMVDEAKKYFKTKCYTTEQIKNLSVLFLTSAGKYLFFDAAFMHVSDQENFASLQSQIKDDYYLRRFKALIGE